jgi:putative hydrolase of the HAD superfamily
MKPRALFFDLDATLLDGDPFDQAIVRTCDLLASRLKLNGQQLKEANDEAWNDYWPGVEKDWTLGVLSGADVSREAWRRTLTACGCEDEALIALACEATLLYTAEEQRLFPDVRDVLDSLRARLPLALITNGASDVQWNKLRGLEIEHYFGAVVMSGEVGIAKPDPAIFRFALDKLGVAPEEVWHVGDSLASDVAGARAAGLRAVWLNRLQIKREDGLPEPDYEIASLKELPGLLDGAS